LRNSPVPIGTVPIYQALEKVNGIAIFCDAVDLFQRLIDWHRADRHRTVAQNPLARFMDAGTG
jgi:thiamine biosynthesis protein ThiC